MAVVEGDTTEANTEPVNFRMPKSLKDKLILMKEYESVASVGELLRSLARDYIKKTMSSADFRKWMEAKELLAKRKEEKN